jgi:hypothetical protein
VPGVHMQVGASPQQPVGHCGPACVQEPVLHTLTRTRPARFKPTEEMEAEELASLPKFHAQPVQCVGCGRGAHEQTQH